MGSGVVALDGGVEVGWVRLIHFRFFVWLSGMLAVLIGFGVRGVGFSGSGVRGVGDSLGDGGAVEVSDREEGVAGASSWFSSFVAFANHLCISFLVGWVRCGWLG